MFIQYLNHPDVIFEYVQTSPANKYHNLLNSIILEISVSKNNSEDGIQKDDIDSAGHVPLELT